MTQEMIDKLGGTALLLNGQAVTFIAQGKYAEAETALGEALEKDPNNPETLVNLVVLAQHQGKSQEQATRLLSQLKDLEPGHPFLQVVYINHFPLLLFRKKQNEFYRRQYLPMKLNIPENGAERSRL